MKPDRPSKLIIDVLTVIFIAFIPGFLCIPFENHISTDLDFIINHYSATFGYLWLCYKADKIEIRHLIKVSTIIWIIMLILNFLIYWKELGIKYTIKGIIVGGLFSEAVCVFAGVMIYLFCSQARAYYKYYLTKTV